MMLHSKRWTRMGMVTGTLAVAFCCFADQPMGMAQEASGGAKQAPQPTTGAPSAAPPLALLEVIPADSWTATTWRDMQGFERKLARLFGQIDFTLPLTPSMGLKAYLNILDGVNENGDAALVLLPPVAGAADDDLGSRSVIVLPARDFAAMLKGLQPSDASEGISRVMLRDQPSYAAKKGEFALFAQREDVLRHVMASKTSLGAKFSPHQRDRYAQNDLSVWVNLAAVTASDEFKEFLKGGGVQALFVDSFKDCREAQLSLRLTEEGLHAETLWSAGGSAPSPAPRLEASRLLAGLPAEGYALAGGLAFADPGELKQWPDLFIGLSEAGGLMDPSKGRLLREVYDSMTRHVKAVRLVALAIPSGGDGLCALVKVVETDGQTQALITGIENWAGLLKQGPFTDPAVNAVLAKVELRREAETIGDVKVHQVTADWSQVERVDLPVLRRIFGQDAPTIRFAAVGEKTLLLTFGGGRPVFESAVSAIKAGSAPIAELAGVKKAVAALPGAGSARGFLEPAQFADLIRAVVKEMGETSTFSLADVHTPVSVLLRDVGPQSKEYDVFIPVDVVKGIKNALLVAPPRQAQPSAGGAGTDPVKPADAKPASDR